MNDPPLQFSDEEIAELKEIMKAQKSAKLLWAIIRQASAWIAGTAVFVAAAVSAWRGLTAK